MILSCSSLASFKSTSAVKPYNPDLPSMVHVVLKLRSDILAQSVHQGLNVCTEDIIAIVPESLHTFLRLMLGGQSLLENGLSDGDKEEDDDDFINDDDDDDEAHNLDSNDAVDEEGKQLNRQQNARVRKQETRVLSIAQDLVYSVSGDRRWAPKHVGLGSSLHQVTRPRN